MVQAVDTAIELTLSQRRVRIYGGMVLAADGQIGTSTLQPTATI